MAVMVVMAVMAVMAVTPMAAMAVAIRRHLRLQVGFRQRPCSVAKNWLLTQ